MANTFKNSITGSAGTGGLIAYTAPTNSVSTVIGVSVANILNENIYIDVLITDQSEGNDAHIIKNALVLPGSNIVLVGGDQKVVLESNDYITVTSTIDNSADVVVSVLEIS